jgi:hypothetical protein
MSEVITKWERWVYAQGLDDKGKPESFTVTPDMYKVLEPGILTAMNITSVLRLDSIDGEPLTYAKYFDRKDRGEEMILYFHGIAFDLMDIIMSNR